MTARNRIAYLALILALYGVWGVVYCAIAIQASEMTLHSLATPLDNLIPFNAYFEYLYVLCYVLPFVPLFVIPEKEGINSLLLSFGVITVIAFVVYLVYPVYCPRPEYTTDSLAAALVAWEQAREWPVNNFPSLHAAYSWLFYLVCRKTNRLVAVMMFAAAVAVSLAALFVKQHFVLDILGGAALAWGVNSVVERMHSSNLDSRSGQHSRDFTQLE
jgi:membrane-associated phospholipid phosphatase